MASVTTTDGHTLAVVDMAVERNFAVSPGCCAMTLTSPLFACTGRRLLIRAHTPLLRIGDADGFPAPPFSLLQLTGKLVSIPLYLAEGDIGHATENV